MSDVPDPSGAAGAPATEADVASVPAPATGPPAGQAAAPASAPPSSGTGGGAGGWIAMGVAVAVLAGVLVVSLWGGSTTPSGPSACGPTASEALDPNSVVRVLPNAPELQYANDPPSSGAFVVGPSVTPVSSGELTRAVQVGLLAEGKVLIQYQPDGISDADLTLVQSLAGDNVVVAPNSGLQSPVVATAWRKRMTCAAISAPQLAKFATVNANRAPADLGASTTTTG